MKLLFFLEGIRNPFLDALVSVITMLGEETLFLAIAVILMWCVDKRESYYVLLTAFFGIMVNQTLKLICKIPRPWVKDPTFTIVESAREAATGYSFPSGHTKNVTCTFGALGAYRPKRVGRVAVCATLILLVAFSRMYLGVHTPADVFASLGLGLLLVLALRPFFASEERFARSMPYIIGVALLASIGVLIYFFSHPETGVEMHNLISARENACTMHGCILGLVLVYFLDRKYIRFETKAKWYIQIFKVAVGLGAVLLIKIVLKAPLNFLCFGNAYAGRILRYFLMVAFAGAAFPLSFRRLSEITVPCLDRFGERVCAFFARKKEN